VRSPVLQSRRTDLDGLLSIGLLQLRVVSVRAYAELDESQYQRATSEPTKETPRK
jgi:hypothetical protein